MRALAAVACLWCVATMPVQAQVFHPETATLKNGLQVVVLPNHRVPVITQMLWFKAGAAYDLPGASGIAHFLEHLNFKGTKNHPEGEYSRIISHMGGQENAFTSYDYTAYYASFGKKNLETVMALEADRVKNWTVTDAQVNAERKVILKERQQTVDNDPIARFWEKVNNTLYDDHPYHRPVIGWKNEIEKLDRAVAEKYHQTYYAPGNAVLILSGDITWAEAKPLVEHYFADWKSFATPQTPFKDSAPPNETQHIDERSSQVRETLWSSHYLVPPARPETIAQSDALLVLSKILGDSRIGRLYRRLVVTDTLATAASCGFDPIAVGPAHWSITVTPRPGVDTQTIEKTVTEEIERLRQDGVTEDEVKDAAQALQVEAIYARDAVTGPAMMVGRALVSGLDTATIEAWPQRMQHVTREAVMAQANRLFAAPPRVIAVLRPEAK